MRQFLKADCAINYLNFRVKLVMKPNFHQSILSVFSNKSDVNLYTVPMSISDSILHFIPTDYAIYYKIDHLFVSSTFFLEGLSFELWIYCVATYVGIFIGFIVLSKVYCYYLKNDYSLSEVMLYQGNFICNQSVNIFWDKLLAWRVLVISGFIFNCIFMIAFSAKFIALMSILHFDQPFNSLEDFATLRTHTLCMDPVLSPIISFKKMTVGFSIIIYIQKFI